MSGSPTVITGTVRDLKGHAVAGARISFVESPTPLPDIAALTAANGTYSLTAPVAGIYRIASHADGFAPQSRTITVDAGSHITLNFSYALRWPISLPWQNLNRAFPGMRLSGARSSWRRRLRQASSEPAQQEPSIRPGSCGTTFYLYVKQTTSLPKPQRVFPLPLRQAIRSRAGGIYRTRR